MAAGIQANGPYKRKTLDEFIADGKTTAQTEFGSDVDLSPTSLLMRFLNVFSQELAAKEQRNEQIYNSFYLDTAQGPSLERVGRTFFGLDKTPAKKAVGEATFSRTVAPASPVTIPLGTLIQTKAGIQFKTIEEVTITSPATSATADIEAVLAGADGNVAANTIVQFVQPISGVETVTNSAVTSGGADKESDDDYRARLEDGGAGRGRATPRAIKAALLAEGATSARVDENDDKISDKSQTAFTSAETGTGDPTMDATNTRVAQKFVLTDRYFVQDLVAKLQADTDLVVTVRIETDSAGSPSGTLADSFLEKTGLDFDGTNNTDIHFQDGAYLEAGTYWVVFTRESGSGSFDGGAGGTADQVKYYDGSWSLATTNENLNIDVVAGLPPGSIHAIVEGLTANEIAEVLTDRKCGGILTHGFESGTDDDGKTRYFSRPTPKTIYVDVTRTTGDLAEIENAIIKHIGGTDLDSVEHTGLAIGADVIFYDLIHAIKEVPNVTGLVVKIGFTASPTGTADLPIGDLELARATTTSVTVA